MFTRIGTRSRPRGCFSRTSLNRSEDEVGGAVYREKTAAWMGDRCPEPWPVLRAAIFTDGGYGGDQCVRRGGSETATLRAGR